MSTWSQFHRQGCSQRIWGLKVIWDRIVPSECSEPPNHESLELTPVVFFCVKKKSLEVPDQRKNGYKMIHWKDSLPPKGKFIVLGLPGKSQSFISATQSRFMFDQSKSQIV